MGAKLKAVRTELILLGLTAVFLGGLLTFSYRDRATAEVAVTAEHRRSGGTCHFAGDRRGAGEADRCLPDGAWTL